MSRVERTQLIEPGLVVDVAVLNDMVGSSVGEFILGTVYDGVIVSAEVVEGPNGPRGITYCVEYNDFA